MPNPVNLYRKKGLTVAAAFASTPNERDREKIRKIAEKLASASLMSLRFIKLEKDKKIAFACMARGGEKAE